MPVSVADLNDTFRRCDRGKDGAKELVLAEFVEALVRLSIRMMGASAAGKKAIKDGKSADGLKRLLEKHVLNNAAKEAMKEMRKAMGEDEDVAAELQSQRLALLKRFNAIASKRAGDPMQKKKKAKAQWGKMRALTSIASGVGGAFSAGAEFSLQTLKAAELVKDVEECRLIVDMKVTVANPVTKERPLSYAVELSRMDIERGFVEAQEQEESLLAVISGGTSPGAAQAVSSMDFDEYLRCLAFCAMTMLRAAKKELAPADRMAVFLDMYLAPDASLTPAEMIAAAVKARLSRAIRRFEPATDLAPRRSRRRRRSSRRRGRG